jgi:hypothetical protein
VHLDREADRHPWMPAPVAVCEITRGCGSSYVRHLCNPLFLEK